MLGRTLATHRRMVMTLTAALVIWASPVAADEEVKPIIYRVNGEFSAKIFAPTCANGPFGMECFWCDIPLTCARLSMLPKEFHNIGSVIDNTTLAHIHTATDYSVGGGGSGCGSCSAGSPSGGLPTLQLDRIHRFRDITVSGSFGPGVFSVYDTKVLFYDLVGDEGVEKLATLFNPSMMGYQSFVDGDTSHPLEPDPVDTLDGKYVSFVNNSSRELILYSDTDIDNLTTEVDDVADATYAVQTGYNGYKTYFRIIDLVGVEAEGTLGDDLVVHLKLDETGSDTVASDSSGNGHDGTVTEFAGDPEWTMGKVGGALDLDDSGDKVVLDTGTGGAYKGITGENERTVALWVKTSMATGSQALVSWGDDADGEKFTLLVRGSGGGYPYSADGKLYIHVNDSDVDGWIYGDDIVADDEWHHVVVVLPTTEGPANVTHCRLYVDGRLQGVSASREQEIDTTDGTNVTIGTDHDGNDLTGLVDDVRIYDRALTEEEITELAIKEHDWAGRLARLEDRNGYTIDLVYKEWSQTDIDESASRQWQIDTITDANGRVATFSYYADQKGGRWSVSQIELPNGGVLDYAYDAAGFLDEVKHPNPVEANRDISTFTRAFNADAKCTVLSYDDAAAQGTHRRKEVYLTALVNVGDDTGFVYPQAANLVRMVVHDTDPTGDDMDEVSYLNMPKSNGYMYVYEGGRRLKRTYLNTFEARVATTWSVDTSMEFGYDDVTFTGEPTFDTQEFTTSEDWHNREPNKIVSSRGFSIEIDDLDYSEASLPTRRKYSDGSNTRVTYNSFQQVTRSEDRLGRVTVSIYDGNGNITSREVGIVNTKVYKADDPMPDLPPDDQPVAGENATYVWEYYPEGDDNEFLLRYAFDAKGNRTEFIYNTDHLLTEIIEPDDAPSGYHTASKFTYDDNGVGNTARRLKTSEDAVERDTEFFYDERDRVIQVQYFDGSTERTAYGAPGSDDENLVVARQDRNGNVTTMEYDNKGRLTLRTTADYTISQADLVDPLQPDLLDITGTPNGVNIAVEYSCTYLEGTNLTDSCTNRGEVTTTAYDYRLRSVERTSTPRDTIVLTTTTEYIDNRVFSVEDPYGRKTFNDYRPSDSALVRTVRATIPDPDDEPEDFDDVAMLSRAGSPSSPAVNAEYLITDYDLDDGGQQVAVIDPRGVVHGTEFDSRGRTVISIQAADEVISYTMGELDRGFANFPGTLHDDHAKSETIYDVQSNVIESRSPRYFDTADTNGLDKAYVTTSYTRRNLRESSTEAPGTAEEATTSQTYYPDGRAATGTDGRDNDWKQAWHVCCGRFQGGIDPLNHGNISNTDFYGNVTHSAVVDDLPNPDPLTGFITGYTVHNPLNKETRNETTTRYDARHRVIATTRWLDPLGSVAQQNPPIFGLDLSLTEEGLTTQFLYDEDLTDDEGLDSTAGMEVQKLGGGTYNVNIVDLLDELAADAGLTGDYFSSDDTDSDGYAVVTINPEEEISVQIMDGAGRTVCSGIIQPWTGTTPNEPITWSTNLLDVVIPLTGLLETASVDALNHIVRSRTDGGGRTIETEDAETNITVFEYDSNSNRLSVLDPNMVGLDCDFDNRNRDISCTDTEGDEIQRAYDKNNNIILLVDAKHTMPPNPFSPPATGFTACIFDARNRRVSCSDRVDSITAYAYDENSNLLTLTDGEGEETVYVYDERNLRTLTTWPDLETTATAYDEARRPELATDQLGDTCTYKYDLANRLETKEYRANGVPTVADTSTFIWDDASRMTEAMTDRYIAAAGTITNTFSWDDVGRMDSEDLDVNFSSAITYTHEYAYDAANRLTQQTYPDLSVVDRDYTDRNQLDDVNYTPSGGSAAAVIDCLFDIGMRETQRTFGNGIVTTRAYDRDDNYVTAINTGTYPGLAFTYGTAGYDDNKNPLLETTGGVMAAYSWTTTGGGSTPDYDDEDRLTFWKRTTGSVSREWPIGATTGLTDVGDWDTVTINGTSQDRNHGSAHEITDVAGLTLAHDVKGNITEDKSKSPDYHYQWDFDNQMSAASVDGSSTVYEIEYTYDALGRRVSKTVPRGMGSVTTVYTCMTVGLAESPYAGQVSSEYAASARTTLPLCKFVYGSYIDEPLILIKVDERRSNDGPGDGGLEAQPIGGTAPASTIVETIYFYHTNRQYCVTGLSDSLGVVLERYAYTPYGGTKILAPNGITVRTVSTYNNPYMYTGRRLDNETGLYHYRARPYDVDLGRFTGRDPNRYQDGPNLYAYVRGCALSAMDPTGLGGDPADLYAKLQTNPQSCMQCHDGMTIDRVHAIDPNYTELSVVCSEREILQLMLELLDNEPSWQQCEEPTTYVPGFLGGSYHLNDEYFTSRGISIPTVVCHGQCIWGRVGPDNSFRFPGGSVELEMYQAWRDTTGILGFAAGAAVVAPVFIGPGTAVTAVESTAILLPEGGSMLGWVQGGRVVASSVPITSHSALGTSVGLVCEGEAIAGAQAFSVFKVGGEIFVHGSHNFGGVLAVSEATRQIVLKAFR